MKPSVRTGIFLVLLCTLQHFTSVDGLLCYQCLSLDCPQEDQECDSIRSLVQSELKTLYHFNNYLDPCPSLSDEVSWESMPNEVQSCPAIRANEATCTLGRMEIKTAETDQNGRSKVRFNYATVLGCATRELLRRIEKAYFEKGVCDLKKSNHSSVGVVRQLEIEHCRELRSVCYEDNFCVSWKDSVVKPWANSKKDTKFEFFFIIGILAVVLIVMLAILLAGLWREPTSRLSNLPRSTGDECETDRQFSRVCNSF